MIRQGLTPLLRLGSTPAFIPGRGKAAVSRQHTQAALERLGKTDTHLRDLQHCAPIQVKGWGVGYAE